MGKQLNTDNIIDGLNNGVVHIKLSKNDADITGFQTHHLCSSLEEFCKEMEILAAKHSH